MSVKLTLSLDEKVIEKAKIYAKERKVSLSFLVEQYFQKLAAEYQTEPGLGTSIVEELSGIVTISPDEDYKKEYADYLSKKHK